MAVAWDGLPPELVEAISRNLTIYADYVRFRAVCRSWRYSTPKIPRHLPPQLPWLMLPQFQLQPHRPLRAFFNLLDNKFHFLNLPEASHGKRRCGSSHGWLAILDESPSFILVNPLTRAKVYLPPLSSFPNVVRFDYSEIGREYILRSTSGHHYSRSLRRIRDSFVKKVVLSSSPLEPNGFVALAILNYTGNLAFCRKSDQAWTFIEDARSFCEDAIYSNGLFYAVNKNGALAVCDVHGSRPRVSIFDAHTQSQFGGDMQYLVNSGDDLLLVTRYLDSVSYTVTEEPDISYKTVRFEVFRMNWKGKRWHKVKSLGDRMLFVGENSSLSVSASDFPGCMGNCIYFTDDHTESNSEFNCDGDFGEHDLGIFKFCDGSLEPLPCYPRNPHSRRHFPPPLWITPDPC